MIDLKVLSARYVNAEKTAAVIATADDPSVLVSAIDSPELWAGLLAQSAISAYVPPAPTPARVSIKQVLYAVNELGLRSKWDAWLATQSQNTRDYFIVESDTLENNPKVARGAAAIGVTVPDLINLALTL